MSASKIKRLTYVDVLKCILGYIKQQSPELKVPFRGLLLFHVNNEAVVA